MTEDGAGERLRQILADAGRLAALRRLNVLDAPPDAGLERLVHLATKALRVPTALVSLVDAERQFFAGARGLPEPWASWRQTPLTHSLCQHAVAARAPLVLDDTRDVPLVRDCRAVPELGAVAYAGVPLLSADGQAVGTFCVLDSRPRHWTADEVEILEDLAATAILELELRAALRGRH